MRASRERSIERSIEQDRIVEEVGHLVRGARHRVEETDQTVHPAAENSDRGLVRPRGRVGEPDEVPRHDRMWPRDVDRTAVRRGRPDEFQHRFGRVVVQDEFVQRVRIERPTARSPAEGALEDREEVRVHPTGTVDVRVSRKDEVHTSVPVGMKQLPFDVQANPSLHRVRFLRMVLRPEHRKPHVHRTIARREKDGASEGARRLRARGMHPPALCPRGDGEPSTRLGEAGEVRTMGNGIKLGPRATILLVVLLAASAVGILTPTLSNTVSKDVQVTGFAVTVTVDGVPETVAPGDVFRVTATLANNANRPIPAVLRMEVRNPNNTVPNELTVYAGCGAEEVVSGTRLIYYIGWHGPLLAPKGTSFAAGTSLATVNGAIGSAEYWPAVLHEIQERDPAGYASLVVPGLNASAGVRNSGSALLKALNYYAMVASSNGDSPNLADWTLSSVFSERFVAFGGAAQDGFLVEVHPQSRGSFIFKLWAERPDGLGIPGHPTYTCGPL